MNKNGHKEVGRVYIAKEVIEELRPNLIRRINLKNTYS